MNTGQHKTSTIPAGRLLACVLLILGLASEVCRAQGGDAKAPKPGDVYAINFANEIWRLPAGDTGGIGEMVLSPPGNNPLWGITADNNLNLNFIYRNDMANNHVLARVNPSGTLEMVANLPLPGSQFFVADIDSGPTNDVYVAFRSNSSASTWIAEVKSNGDVFDLQTGQKLTGPFTSPPFAANFGADLAVNSRDEVFVLASILGNDILYRAPAGGPVIALGTFNGSEVEFAGDVLWGSIPQQMPVGTSQLVRIQLPAMPAGPLQPLPTEMKGTFPFYGNLDYDEEFLIGNGEERLIYMDVDPEIVEWVPVEWRDSRFKPGRNYTVAPRTVRPASPAVRAPTGQNDGHVKDPISAATGEFYDSITDLSLRGLIPIAFTRYYSSAPDSAAPSAVLGNNWTHNYNLALQATATTASVQFERGQAVTFQKSGAAWQPDKAHALVYQLVQSGSSYRFLDPAAALIYTFNADAGGRLERIEDRNGNSLALGYTGTLLTRVSDDTGRSLDLTYDFGKLVRVQDHSGRGVAFAYTENDLTSVTDVAGGKTTYTYSTPGRLSVLARPAGNTLSQTYDSSARSVSQTDGVGNRTTLAYDTPGAGQTTVTDPLGAQSILRHENGRNMTEQVDELGNSVTFAYDSNFRRSLVKDRLGNATTYRFHAPSGLIEVVTYPDGARVTYSYAQTTTGGLTFYDLTRASYPDGTSEQFAYDSKGNVTTRTDRSGQRWLFTYNSRGQLLTATAPSGGIVTTAYNSDATVASIQFPGAQAATFEYDALRRTTARKNPDGTTLTYAYDARDLVVSITDERGGSIRSETDRNGRPVRRTDEAGGATSYTYDGNNRLTRVQDALGHAVTFSYDGSDRLTSLTYANAAVLAISYDAAGNPIAYTDGEGKVWRESYDKEGRLVSSTTPLGERTQISRDVLGRVTSLTTPKGNTHNYAYDLMNRITSITDPLGGVTRFTYDARGELTSYTLPSGAGVSYTRDSLGKITQITDANGQAWRYGYDGAGRLMSQTDPLGNAQTYTRDSRGRISRVALPGGATLTLTSDGAGNVTQAAYSDGTVIGYSYDPRGRLATATGLSLAYDARGLMAVSNGLEVERDALRRTSRITLAPGKVVTYGYDRRDLVTEVRDWTGGVTRLEYDDASRLISVTRPNAVTTRTSYDADGRIVSIIERRISDLASTTLVRDKKGLIVEAARNVPLVPTVAGLTPAVRSQTFDAASRLQGASHDALGRRTSGDGRTLTWDLASRLTRFSEGGETTQFTHDARGLMLSQTRGASSRQYVWNYALDLPSIAVVREAGNDLRYYVHTPAGELLYSVEAASGSRRFYHYDEIGNTLFLTDDTGAITDSYAYSPYGVVLASSGSTDNPFTFVGRYGVVRLGTGGLYFMRRRVYDSASGSFLSRDPVQLLDPRLVNPYQYAAGNPLFYVDVTGDIPAAGDVAQGSVDAVSGIGGTAGIAGHYVGEAAQHGKEIADVLENALPLEEVVGRGRFLKEVNYTTQLVKQADKLGKVAKTLDVIDKVGTAANVLQVGLNGYQHYAADQQAMKEADDQRTASLKAFGDRVRFVIKIYKEKRISIFRRDIFLNKIALELRQDLDLTGLNEESALLLNAIVAYKNGIGSFVPVPLNWLGLTPEDQLKGDGRSR